MATSLDVIPSRAPSKQVRRTNKPPTQQTKEPVVSAFNTSHIIPKYRALLNTIFKIEEKVEKIEWDSVVSMMTSVSGFRGKLHGTSGASRQFILFLQKSPGKPTHFTTEENYKLFLKESKRNHLSDEVKRIIIHTEQPHSRGMTKKGNTRYFYPTLLKLLVSSLEAHGLTPKILGWEE